MSPTSKEKEVLRLKQTLDEIHDETLAAIAYDDWAKAYNMASAYRKMIVKGGIDAKG